MAQLGITWDHQLIPTVTRAYTVACLITTAAVEADIISPFQLYFNTDLIFRKLQIWRLITNFLYFGELGLSFFFNMIFMYRYCKMLEETSFRGRTADFVFMFLFGGFLITYCKRCNYIYLFLSQVKSILRTAAATTSITIFYLLPALPFLSQALTLMLVYVWCRRNPYIKMNAFGLVTLQASCLPWVLLCFTFLTGESILVDLLGIAAGHTYFFLEDIFPNQPGGKKLLVTPAILKQIFDVPLADPNYNPLPEDSVNRPHQD